MRQLSDGHGVANLPAKLTSLPTRVLARGGLERNCGQKPRPLIEVAHKGLNKRGEELCGDWVKISTAECAGLPLQ